MVRTGRVAMMRGARGQARPAPPKPTTNVAGEPDAAGMSV
jgi:hypothetical protein